MSTFINDTEAIARFTNVFSYRDSADDLGPRLSCIEADALAGMLRALGESATADMWIKAHAEGDEECDDHYHSPVSDYVVPVDPMDDLQCDSCQ